MNERQITPVTHQSNVPAGINFFDPTTIETLNRFSTMFANSSLVPESYRIGGVVGGKTGEGPKKTVSEAEAVANCVIAFDVATRIGASPLMVMQNLYIVYGRPSWSSKFLIATINTCGRFEPLKFELTSNGVCNNGVANVKCVAWTTPKGVTHDENGNRLHQNHHLPYVVQPLPYKWRLMRVGIAKTAASGVLCPNRCYVTVPPRSGALHTHRNCQWVCVPLKKM